MNRSITPPMAALAILFLFPLAFAAPEVKVHTQRYAIEGETAAALRKSLNDRSPVWQENRHYDAHTAWRVNWRYWFDGSGNGCELTKVTTSVEVRFTLPEWPDRAMAPAALKARWDVFYDALLAHENGHMQFGVEAAGEIEQALAGLAPHASCDAMDKAAGGLARQVLQKFVALEKQYDIDTDHGMATGAVFP